MQTKINLQNFFRIGEEVLSEEELLKRIASFQNPLKITQNIISEAVEDVLRVPYSRFKTNDRSRSLVQARQMYSFFMRYYLKWTLKEIGISLGKDHSAIITNITTYHDRCLFDPGFEDKARAIDKQIKIRSYKLALNEVSLSKLN